ncbi:SMP-30/gluconolactonase/LRE family protein [Modestobacter sp. NPDC049651]|uniref:SMP-30/gluconolactonase/LRE family protein n=1 Tax=unclassified Modestobacter TaxID=2643866 RepID=UPI0033E2B0B3
MIRLTAQPASPSPAWHGEGPVWDAEHDRLLWVDITGGMVHTGTVSGDDVVEQAARRAGGTVGFVVPVAGGGWLTGADGGFTHLPADGPAETLVELTGEGGTEESGGTRMNDGGCDRAGRLYGGTMAFDERPGASTLYRVDLDGTVTTVFDGLTISNGIGWSPDDRTMYLSDSGNAVVWAMDYDLDTGRVGERRDFRTFDGPPADGLTVDDEGCVWTAHWSGGMVQRWSPDGELLARVDVPTDNTSSCAFAGADRGLLVISTSNHNLPHELRSEQVDAGRLFTVRPGVTGPAAFPYRGPLTRLRQR